MSITVPIKDVGDNVQDKFIDNNYAWALSDGAEEYIKREMMEDGRS